MFGNKTRIENIPNFEESISISAVSKDDFGVMLRHRNYVDENICQESLLSTIEAYAKEHTYISLRLKDDTYVDGRFQGIAADIDDDGEVLGYDVVGLLNHNEVLLIPDYLIASIERKPIRTEQGNWRIIRNSAFILIVVIAIITSLFIDTGRHNVRVLSRKAYYTEEVSDFGFIIRSYFDRKTNELIAESFGYEIMDDSVDIDGDGKNELLCTCEWGGDGKIELYIFKDMIGGIYKGYFTPEDLHLEDIRENGSTDFICYYLPTPGEIQGEYWTDDCLRILTVTYDQARYEPFPEVEDSKAYYSEENDDFTTAIESCFF